MPAALESRMLLVATLPHFAQGLDTRVGAECAYTFLFAIGSDDDVTSFSRCG